MSKVKTEERRQSTNQRLKQKSLNLPERYILDLRVKGEITNHRPLFTEAANGNTKNQSLVRQREAVAISNGELKQDAFTRLGQKRPRTSTTRARGKKRQRSPQAKPMVQTTLDQFMPKPGKPTESTIRKPTGGKVQTTLDRFLPKKPEAQPPKSVPPAKQPPVKPKPKNVKTQPKQQSGAKRGREEESPPPPPRPARDPDRRPGPVESDDDEWDPGNNQ